MSEPQQTLQRDFDEIALLPTDGFDHNSYYHNYLLRQIPNDCHRALEIGCGSGAFSRRLTNSSRQVLAVDLSPQMIQAAKARAATPSNLDFQIGDAMTMEFQDQSFDCIASIATLHHLPMNEILIKLKRALRVGGRLIVLDLFQAQGFFDVLASAAALPLSGGLRLIKTGRLRQDRRVRAAWQQHAKHDTYLTLAEVRDICAEILPKAQIKQHLFWRYSIIWNKEID
jgi:ubiquinone/menaquinone biosynthesis C-methylase UbiE